MKTQTHREDHVRAQGEDGRVHAEERGLRRNLPADPLIWGFQSPELRENKFLLFKLSRLWYSVMQLNLTNTEVDGTMWFTNKETVLRDA